MDTPTPSSVLATMPKTPVVTDEDPTRAANDFMAWFGQSRIVTPDGEPMLLFHGTTARFTTFDLDKRGANTQESNTALGFFFLADSLLARDFARNNPLRAQEAEGLSPIVMAVHLAIERPINLVLQSIFADAQQAPTIWEILSDGERLSGDEALARLDENVDLGSVSELYTMLGTQRARDVMIRDGFDGVISNFGCGVPEYVAFHPEQIRVIEADYPVPDETASHQVRGQETIR